MSMPLERLEAEALELSTRERAWQVEIERRLAAYRAGEMEAVPADEALARIRARLRERS